MADAYAKGCSEMKKSARITLPRLRAAAQIARDFGVTVTLDAEGKVVISPVQGSNEDDPKEVFKRWEASRT